VRVQDSIIRHTRSVMDSFSMTHLFTRVIVPNRIIIKFQLIGRCGNRLFAACAHKLYGFGPARRRSVIIITIIMIITIIIINALRLTAARLAFQKRTRVTRVYRRIRRDSLSDSFSRSSSRARITRVFCNWRFPLELCHCYDRKIFSAKHTHTHTLLRAPTK